MKKRVLAEKPIEDASPGRMRVIDGEDKIASEYQSYLRDESGLSGGKAQCIAFPRCEADVSRFLASMDRLSVPVTISGGRTGVTGGAVPFGGALLSLEKMDRILEVGRDEKRDEWYVRAQPGVLLKAFHERIEGKDFQDLLSSKSGSVREAASEFMGSGVDLFYPVDVTETSASLGGTVATNASGERSYRYGATRDHVRAIRLALPCGDVLSIRRGEVELRQGEVFEIVLSGGAVTRVTTPDYRIPTVKNAAGYYVKDGMDLIDLFIGSEGTLGVMTEIEVKIVEKPGNILSLVAFFPSERDAVGFFIEAREEVRGVLVFEYFDAASLSILRDKKEQEGPASGIPSLPPTARAGIFFEVEFSEKTFDELYSKIEALFRKHRSSIEESWSGVEQIERDKIRSFRHALPEAVNELVSRNRLVCPAVHKIGTDIAVPRERLEEMIDHYYGILNSSGMRYAVFGHIGESHLHVNLLPGTEDEVRRAKEIHRRFAEKGVVLGGTISAEHGIGKIKRDLLEILYGIEGIREMARVKKTLDPGFILNRGNIFPEDILREH